MCSSAPNTDGINRAAETSAALSKETLDWYKTLYADSAPDRAAASARANEVSDAQLAQMRQQTSIAADYDKYNKQTYRPLENQIVALSQNYDTQGRRDAAAGAAAGGVEQQWTAAAESQRRELARQGVDPNSGRALAMGNQNALGLAAAKAGAATTARNQVETTGFARKMDAASLGRNLASSQSTAAGLALNAGNASTASAQVPVAMTQAGANIMNQGFSGAQASNNASAQQYGTIASIQNQANQNDNMIWTAAGSALGSYLGKPAVPKIG